MNEKTNSKRANYDEDSANMKKADICKYIPLAKDANANSHRNLSGRVEKELSRIKQKIDTASNKGEFSCIIEQTEFITQEVITALSIAGYSVRLKEYTPPDLSGVMDTELVIDWHDDSLLRDQED